MDNIKIGDGVYYRALEFRHVGVVVKRHTCHRDGDPPLACVGPWFDVRRVLSSIVDRYVHHSQMDLDTEQEVEMEYKIWTRDEEGDYWSLDTETSDLAAVKHSLEEALEDHNKDDVMLCVVKEFGMKLEVEL